MERPAGLTIPRHPFSPRQIVAVSGAVLLEAVAIYIVAAALAFSGGAVFPRAVQVEFLKAPLPKERPVVLPQLRLVEPPTPIVPPPEIQIQTPRPAPRITVAKMRRRPVVTPEVVQFVAPPPTAPRLPGITAPVSIGASHSCEQRYPAPAVRLNQQGTTTVRFTVNTDGSVSNVRVANSSGHEMLDDAAIRCASAWRYRPAFENGRPVSAPWTTNVQWKLRNASRPA